MNVRDSAVSDMPSRLEANLVPFGHGCHATVDPVPGLYAFWLRGTCLYVGMTKNLERRISEHEAAEDNATLEYYFSKFGGEIKMSIAYVTTSIHFLRELESESIAALRPITNAQNGGGNRT